MVEIVLRVTPLQCLPVEICYIVEYPVSKEILLHESHKAFYFPLCKGMIRFAELSVKPYCPHKRLIILLPHRMAIQITAEDNAFHVVRQHIPRDAHVLKCVDHSYKEVFLLGIGKGLNIALSAMVADHSEASYAVGLSIVVQHIGKAPVHLVSLTGICGITATSVALRCSLLPLGRKKILMGGDVVLYNGQLTIEARLLQTLQDDCGVADTLL